MNPKLINYEKLCNRILVPRLNGVFSKYSDTRITEISIFDIPNSKAKDKFNHELYHIKVIVKYVNPPDLFVYNGITPPINYMLLNLTSYVFEEKVLLSIFHIAKGYKESEATFYTGGHTQSDDESIAKIEYRFEDN